MSPILLSVCLGVSGLGVFMFLHILILQFFKMPDRMKYFNRLFLVILVFVCIAGFIVPNNVSFINNEPVSSLLLILFFLFMALFMAMVVYAVLDHSVRTRLIIEMLSHKQTPLMKSKISKDYDPLEAIKKRLDQLATGGYADSVAKGYKLTSKGRLFAKISYYGKLVYRMGMGG